MATIDITPFEHDLLVGERILWTGRPNLSQRWLYNPVIVNERLARLPKTHYAISTHRVFVYEPRQKSTMPIEKIKSLALMDRRNEQGYKFHSPNQDLYIGDIANSVLMMELLLDVKQVLALLVSLRAKTEFLQPTSDNFIDNRLQGEQEMWAFSPDIRFGSYLVNALLKLGFVFWALLSIVAFIIVALKNPESIGFIMLLCGAPLLLFFGAYVLDTRKRYSKEGFPRYVITDSRVLTLLENDIGIAFIDSLQTISQVKHWRFPNTIDLHSALMPWLVRLDDPDAVLRLLAELQAKAKDKSTSER